MTTRAVSHELEDKTAVNNADDALDTGCSRSLIRRYLKYSGVQRERKGGKNHVRTQKCQIVAEPDHSYHSCREVAREPVGWNCRAPSGFVDESLPTFSIGRPKRESMDDSNIHWYPSAGGGASRRAGPMGLHY
ncbi:hypothetical protein O3P69_020586 [Scylla paramamosain]|uniref:Uncharacterized protein n=1 Tax=Scylla paramamosain TaxID=85552 RepID=A0AAW0TLT3_SCYPA